MIDDSLIPSLKFEARKLRQYSEPIKATDLKEGSVYFSLNFCDERMLIPVVEPVVFIGKNLRSSDVGVVLYFQEIDSYLQGLRFNSATESDTGSFQSGTEGQFKYIFEFERALDELMKCALRRKRAGAV
jgi:hypothetical protein